MRDFPKEWLRFPFPFPVLVPNPRREAEVLLAPRSAGPCPKCADEKHADEERPEKPNMEDQAEAPSIDVIDILLSDLTSCRT